MKGPLRIGILGTGDGAHNHVTGLDGFDPNVAVLHSICGRDPDRTRAFAGWADQPDGIYVDRAAFLADPYLDAVIVATPDALHKEHAVAAMRAGKHVLVEKPLAITARDAEDMARMAQHCGVRLGVGFHMRHHAGHQLLREVYPRFIGDIRHIHLDWATRSMAPDNWRATSQEGWWALAALGSHALDLVRWLSGGSARANVFATKGASATGRDERVAMHLELEHGVTASIRVSVADAPTKYVRLSGTEGVIECRDTLGGRNAGGGEIVLPGGTRLGFDPVNPFFAQIAAFAAAVREGRDPDASAHDGIQNVRWLELAGDAMSAHLP